MAPPNSPSLRGIQYLRAVAAISVLFFHVSETFRLQFRVGAAGVDIFFVISGFIMWATTSGRNIPAPAFASRRIIRVVPIYWIATCVTAVAAFLKPAFFPNRDVSVGNIVRSLLFVPDAAGDRLNPVLVQGWTLTYEMFFYALFGASLLAPMRLRLWLLSATLIAICAANPLLGGGFASILSNPLLVEFLAGIWIAVAWKNTVVLGKATSVAVMIFGTALLVFENFHPLDLPRFIGWGGPAALIVAGVVSLETHGMMLENRALHFLGDASYSIYIWHDLFGVMALAVLLRCGITGQSAAALVAMASLTLAIAAYRLVEKPLNQTLHLRRKEAIG
jgi:exopolysaccharide production protein ExoZ